MTWNHRVMKTHYSGEWGEEDTYTIHEVYYDDDGNTSYTGEIAPRGNSIEELKAELQHMLDACDKAIYVPPTTLDQND